MDYVNLTPHAINLADAEGNILNTVAPSGVLARVITPKGGVVEVPGYPTVIPLVAYVEGRQGNLEGLPPAIPGTLYIVSGMCMDAALAAGRTDVVCPGTGPDHNPIRDKGQVVAVRCLVKVTA